MRQAIFKPWASSETNYPSSANAWSLGSIFLSPTSDYFTPQTPVPAQTMNTLLNARDANANALLANFSAEEAANWLVPSQYVINSSYIHGGACYDAFMDRWIVGTRVTGGIIGMVASEDGGLTWATIGNQTTGVYDVISVCTRPSDGLILTTNAANGTTNGNLHTQVAGSGTWTLQNGAGVVPMMFAAASMYYAAQSCFVVLGANGTAPPVATTGYAWSSTSGTGSWLNVSGNLPTSFLTGLNGKTILGFYGAQSSTACMFGVGYTGGGAVCMSTTLAAFVDVTPSGGGVVMGVSYDAATLTWVCTTTNGSIVKVFSAPDNGTTSITWTLVRTFGTGSAPFYAGGSVACDGALWAVSLTSSPRGGQDLVYTQNGGATWNYARYKLKVKVASTGMYDTVLAGGGQFLAINSDNQTASQAVGPGMVA